MYARGDEKGVIVGRSSGAVGGYSRMGWSVFCIHAPTTAVVEEGKSGGYREERNNRRLDGGRVRSHRAGCD